MSKRIYQTTDGVDLLMVKQHTDHKEPGSPCIGCYFFSEGSSIRCFHQMDTHNIPFCFKKVFGKHTDFIFIKAFEP